MGPNQRSRAHRAHRDFRRPAAERQPIGHRRPAGQTQVGLIYFGNGNNYIIFDGTHFWINNAGGQRIYMVGDPWVYRPASPTTGFIHFGLGRYLGFDGTNWQADGFLLHTSANTDIVNVPLGAVVWFRTQAELNAAGARFARETAPDGRILIGYGSASGIPGSASQKAV